RHRATRVGLLESELEPQHEVPPGLRSPAQGRDDRRALFGGEPVRLEQLHHLHRLDVRLLLDLELLALALARVVLDVALAREVAAEAHRDRARGDLGESRRDDQRRRSDGAGQAGRRRAGPVERAGGPGRRPRRGLDLAEAAQNGGWARLRRDRRVGPAELSLTCIARAREYTMPRQQE